MTRARWHKCTGSIVLAWLAFAALVAVLRQHIGSSTWLMIHVLLLGAATNAIVIWSGHFSVALLRLPDRPNRRGEVARLAGLNLGIVGLLFAVVSGMWPLTLAAGLFIFAVVGWHTGDLIVRMRRALPSRFGPTVRYYALAGMFLMVGVALGVVTSRGLPDGLLQLRLSLAHATVNLLGWVGLTVVGTLITLWPTILRTQAAPGSERTARLALPVLGAGVGVAAFGMAVDQRLLAVGGLAVYAVGLLFVTVLIAIEIRQKRPASFAAWSVLASWVWLLGSVAALTVIVAASAEWTLAMARSEALVGVLIVGFVAQILAGALSYLLPVMVGGGPASVRWRNHVVDRAAVVRVSAVNLSLVVLLLPVSAAVSIAAWSVLTLCLAAFLVLVVRSMASPPGRA